MKKETISIKDENGKEYVFEKPDFKCELLKVVNYKDQLCIIGWIDRYGEVEAVYISAENGDCYVNGKWDDDFDFTPIKPKQYEDENNFPAMIVKNDNGDNSLVFKSCYSKIDAIEYIRRRWRLATKEEVLTLQYEGKDA